MDVGLGCHCAGGKDCGAYGLGGYAIDDALGITWGEGLVGGRLGVVAFDVGGGHIAVGSIGM